jgi:hypothetical protein
MHLGHRYKILVFTLGLAITILLAQDFLTNVVLGQNIVQNRQESTQEPTTPGGQLSDKTQGGLPQSTNPGGQLSDTTQGGLPQSTNPGGQLSDTAQGDTLQQLSAGGQVSDIARGDTRESEAINTALYEGQSGEQQLPGAESIQSMDKSSGLGQITAMFVRPR